MRFIFPLLVLIVGTPALAKSVKYLEIDCEILPVCRINKTKIFTAQIELRMSPKLIEEREALKDADQWDDAHQETFNKAYVPELKKALRTIIIEELLIEMARPNWTDDDEETLRLLRLVERWNRPQANEFASDCFKRNRLLFYASLHLPKEWDSNDSEIKKKVRSDEIKRILNTQTVTTLNDAGRDVPVPLWFILDEQQPAESNRE